MRREAKKLLFDIHEACLRLERFADGKSFEHYEQDELLRAGVERQFEIIGEAIGRLARLEPGVAERITDYLAIIAFRNQVIHGYDAVDNTVVWGVLRAKLPALHQQVASLLKEGQREHNARRSEK